MVAACLNRYDNVIFGLLCHFKTWHKINAIGLNSRLSTCSCCLWFGGFRCIDVKRICLCFQTQQFMLSNNYKVTSFFILNNSLFLNSHCFKEILGLSADLSCSLLHVLLQISLLLACSTLGERLKQPLCLSIALPARVWPGCESLSF